MSLFNNSSLHFSGMLTIFETDLLQCPSKHSHSFNHMNILFCTESCTCVTHWYQIITDNITEYNYPLIRIISEASFVINIYKVKLDYISINIAYLCFCICNLKVDHVHTSSHSTDWVMLITTLIIHTVPMVLQCSCKFVTLSGKKLVCLRELHLLCS